MRISDEFKCGSIYFIEAVINRTAISYFFFQNDALFFKLPNLALISCDQCRAVSLDNSLKKLIYLAVNQLPFLFQIIKNLEVIAEFYIAGLHNHVFDNLNHSRGWR
ncbi:MAG: hypothetical protein SFW63_00480 [Alphaproteobacteria bacterium]|nr:hypothetical protein [Alphaproteobacteria bacterium]